MDIVFRKKFLKQLANISTPIRTNIEVFVFEELPQAKSVFETGKIEKMHGYKGFYKARFGSYPVGIELKPDNSMIIYTVMHRREIYRFFP